MVVDHQQIINGKSRDHITLDGGASALIKPSGRWEQRNASIACRAKRSSALMASAIAMLKISLGAASGQFLPRKKFCGIDIFLRVDRRRAARFPYNGNFTVYGAFPAVFSRQRKGYQPCSPQCTGRGYWCGTGNHSGLPQSAAPQPSQRLPPAQGRAQRWQYQQTILSDPGASVAPPEQTSRLYTAYSGNPR